MEILKILLLVCTVLSALVLEVKCQSSSLQAELSSSACHGPYSDETTVNATCSDGHVIAISGVTLGSKLNSTGCPSNYDASYNFSTCCTKDDLDDCTFPLYLENYIYHKDCDGRQTCKVQTQAQVTATTCSSSVTFTSLSRYMFMEFFCIEDDKMVELCSTTTSALTRENTAVYIWNKDFGDESSIDPSDSSCNCSVEIDNCAAGINIYKMLRILTGDVGSTCNQTIRIADGENNTLLLEWNCDDNKRAIENYNVQATYMLLNLENTRNDSDGKIWMGFEATANSNITVSCPPASQQHCMQTTTSTTVTAANVTTVTTSTTTEKMTSTTTTEPISSTKSSTTTTTSPQNETLAGGADKVNDDYFPVVIALAVLLGVCVIVIIILSCCLFLRCRVKDHNDVEKVVIVNKPSHQEPVEEAKPALPVRLSLVDFGCQVHIEQVNDSTKTSQVHIEQVNDSTNTSQENRSQKSENLATKVDEIRIELSEFGCQVNLTESKIENDLDLSVDKSTQTEVEPLKQEDKCVTTVPISLTHRQCQTVMIKKKTQKSQVNFKTKINSQTSSTQTDFILQEKPKQEDVEQTTIVPEKTPIKPVANGNIPEFQHQDEAIHSKPNNVILRHRHKKRRKKKKITRSDDERYSLNISPDSLDVHSAEEPVANKRFLFTPEPEIHRMETVIHLPETDIDSDCNHETDTEAPDTYNKEVRPIQVRPFSPTTPQIKHIYKVRNVMASSFFSKEKYEEKMIRMIKRQSKNKRIKKGKDSQHSKC